ncbi:MAG: cytochrome c biogenesis protein ResB [Actinomycetota bacterium]|nr:cytochrome c biogenesis protein ResB [Actinomycetota bacterium]
MSTDVTAAAQESADAFEPAEALSTQPAPVGPAGGSARGMPALGAPLRRAWRQLTSMRTALFLLFLLALAAVPGSLLPQRGLNPVKVSTYYAAHPALAPVLDKLSLFDVFAAPWFAAVYLLLFLSLAGCLVPRTRWHASMLRAAPPAAPRNLAKLPASAQWETAGEPAEVAAAAAAFLRRRRWRVVVRPDAAGRPTVAAEKGYLRETGNLVFHLSLLVLLVGIALGGLFGYKGTILVKQGDGFANTVSQYDNFVPGRLFRPSMLSPFAFTLDRFSATYQDSGAARTFDAQVSVTPAPGRPTRQYDVRVNHPLDVGGTKAYLIGHGYAPRLRITDADGSVTETAAPFLPQDGAFTSTGVVKVPDLARAADGSPRQLGLRGSFSPTTAVSPAKGFVSIYPGPRDPGLVLVAFRGDLGLDSGVPQSVYALDTRHMKPIGQAFLLPGQSLALPDGGSVMFTGFTEWATFQVGADPGKLTALLASVGILVGLLLSLRIRRRRVWLRLSPADEGSPSGAGEDRRTVVAAGGLARTDADSFSEEFRELLGPLQPPSPSPSPSFPPASSKE